MKKQILFLAIFSLAVLAGTNNAWAQTLEPGVTSTNPIDPLTCIAASEPLHPFAGVPYKYSLDGNNGEEVASSYTWWATQNTSFVTGAVTMPAGTNTNLGGRLVSPAITFGSTYGVTTPASTVGADSVEITWSSAILALTKYQATAADAPKLSTFVVGYAEGENCADNIQVYEINPLPNFTIDIAAIDTSLATPTTVDWDIDTVNYCVDVIRSATYSTTNFDLTVDHGQNVIYYEIAAANFVTNWTPTFQITSGLRNTQTATISLHVSLADAQSNSSPLWTSAAIDESGMNTDITTGERLAATDPLDVATGVSVYVRVVIDNNTEESLTENPFILAVDAIDDDETGIWDMDDSDCGVDPTTIVPDRDDLAEITITPRPQLDHNTQDDPTGPEPTNRVPKVDGDGTEYPRY